MVWHTITKRCVSKKLVQWLGTKMGVLKPSISQLGPRMLVPRVCCSGAEVKEWKQWSSFSHLCSLFADHTQVLVMLFCPLIGTVSPVPPLWVIRRHHCSLSPDIHVLEKWHTSWDLDDLLIWVSWTQAILEACTVCFLLLSPYADVPSLFQFIPILAFLLQLFRVKGTRTSKKLFHAKLFKHIFEPVVPRLDLLPSAFEIKFQFLLMSPASFWKWLSIVSL